MGKRIRNAKNGKRKSIQPDMVGHPEQPDGRTQYFPTYQCNSKRAIERFFRLHPFSPKSAKKLPKKQAQSVLSLCELNALVEAMRRRVDDQKRDHKRTLRKAGRSDK